MKIGKVSSCLLLSGFVIPLIIRNRDSLLSPQIGIMIIYLDELSSLKAHLFMGSVAEGLGTRLSATTHGNIFGAVYSLVG